MATPVGGLRSHYILHSLWSTVANGLIALSWDQQSVFHKPLTQARDGISKDTPVGPNLISLQTDRTSSADWELGSNFSEHRRIYYFDVLAENRTVAEHLCGDIKDILEGRLPSIGRSRANIPVTEWNLVDNQPNYVSVGTPPLATPEGFVLLGDSNVVLGPGDTVFTYAQVAEVDVDPLIEDPSIKHREFYWTVRVVLEDYYGNEDDV